MSDDVTTPAVGVPEDATPAGHHLAQRTMLNLGGVVTSNLARLAALAMISHAGGAATLGNVQSAVSGANLAALLGPSSVGGAAGRYLPIARTGIEEVAKRILLHGTWLGLGLAGLWAVGLIPFFGAQIGLATAALTLVLCSWVVARGVVIGEGVPLASMLRIEAAAAVGLVVVIALVVRAGVPWPVYVLALPLLHLPLVAWVWMRHRSVRPARTVGPGYRHYVGFAVVGTVASAGLVHVMNLVTNGLGGAEQAGFLAAGLLLLSPLGMAFGALTQVSLPWVSRLVAADRTDEALGRARQLTAGVHFVVGTVLLCVVPVGPALGRVVFGADMRLDSLLLIVLGCASLSIGSRVGSAVLLSAHGHTGVRRMAGLSYVGLAVALVTWAVAYGVRGEVPAIGAGLGYGLGASVVTTLVAGAALGVTTATRLGLGIGCWVGVSGTVAYAVSHPDPLAAVLALVGVTVWAAANGEGIRCVVSWARARGRR